MLLLFHGMDLYFIARSSCVWVLLVRLVHLVILWWTPGSSCRAVHSASLKFCRSCLSSLGHVSFIWSFTCVLVDRCAWAAGQTGRVGQGGRGTNTSAAQQSSSTFWSGRVSLAGMVICVHHG